MFKRIIRLAIVRSSAFLTTAILWSSLSFSAQPAPLSATQQDALYQALALAERHSIDVQDLGAHLLNNLSSTERSSIQLEVLEQLIQRFALGQYSSDLDRYWSYPVRSIDLRQTQTAVLAEPDMLAALAEILPQHSDYLGLVKAYAQLERINDTEPSKVQFHALIHPGQSHDSLVQIRKRLTWRGYDADNDLSSLAPRLYDELLLEQVLLFQADHGLTEDGVIGPQTLGWLNRSAQDLQKIVATALERWRWLPRDLGEEYLLVSIPGFEVRLFDRSGLAKRYISISGRPARPTRSFSASVEQVVVNPNWTVPKRIMILDKLPKIQQDPINYLASHQMVVQRFIDGHWLNADPASVDWSGVGWSTDDLRLVQDAGDSNALGKLKFHMPNAHAIYLHDTPTKELFSEASRAFSSGCIRVQGVEDLARKLMHDRVSELDAELQQADTRWIRLPKPVPVYLAYLRAWPGENGRLQLRDDVYSADKQLLSKFESKLKNAQLVQR